MRIAPYIPGREAEQVFELWQRNFGDRWPISLEVFREITEAVFAGVETYNLVATNAAGAVLGYLASQVRPRTDTEASILVLMVDPRLQRQGVGTRLLSAAVDRFRSEKIDTVHLGANAELAFWQGIPTYLPSAKPFFEKHGWEIYEKSYDLVGDLRRFRAPDWVIDRPRQHGVCIRTAKKEDIPALLEFLSSEFPDWRRWFVAEADARGTGGIVVAVRDDQVLGCMILKDTRSTDWRGWQWQTLLGEDMGGIGAVGVARAHRRKGIGLAMVAEASRLLRDRGIRNCFVGWTWLIDWYGELDYKVWHEYWMARKFLRH